MIRISRLMAAIAAIVLLAGFCADGAALEGAGEPQPGSVIVYYFHGGPRCQNCYNMENWTKELVESGFKDQVSSGRLVFKAVDTDLGENQRFIKEYSLYTKTVLLSLVKDGKEVKCANLAKVWNFLGSKEKFQQYVKGEIEKYLKEL